MPQPDQLRVELDFQRDWCDRHLEPYRKYWPKHAPLAMVLLFDAFVLDQRVIDMAPEAETGGANAQALPNIILECAPLCCFVGDETMAQIYKEAKAGWGPRIEAMSARKMAAREQADDA